MVDGKIEQVRLLREQLVVKLKFTDRGTSAVQSDGGQQPVAQQRQEVPQQKRASTEEPTERRSGADEEEGGDGKKTGEKCNPSIW